MSMSEVSQLPAPPQPPEHPSMSMPYQSMSISSPSATLAGHSMPMTSNPRQPIHTTPVSGSPGSLPPQYARAPSHPGHAQQPQIVPSAPAPQAAVRTQPSNTRRILVILTAAVIVSTIGIILLLAQ
jgi:hypothetical protein